ncbi:LAETG motif-containing sortase-dependent surface protein [Streptomyces sp. NPDC048420]
MTPYLVGGALVLLVAGGGAVAPARRPTHPDGVVAVSLQPWDTRGGPAGG